MHSSSGPPRPRPPPKTAAAAGASLYSATNEAAGLEDESDQEDPTAALLESAEALAARLPVVRRTRDLMQTKLQHMYRTQQLPDSYSGAVELTAAPGRGWGLMATSVIQAGEPILICAPLALIAGPPGRPPGAAELQQVLQSARWLTPSRRLLELLCDGETPRASDAEQEYERPREARRRRDEERREGRAGGGSALMREQEREMLAVLQELGIEAGGFGEDREDEEAALQDLEAAAARKLQRRRAAADGGAVSGSSSTEPPMLRSLLKGLSDEKQDGQLGSRPPIRMDNER